MRNNHFTFSALIIAAFISLAFQWPWDVKAKKPTVPSPAAPKMVAPKEAPAQPEAAPANSEGQTESEIEKVQTDLANLANETKIVESGAPIDRANLQKIIAQVEVQRRLLESLRVTNIQTAIPVVNTEEVVRAAKVRLLADEVRRTQETLRAIQSVPKVQSSVPVVPNLSKREST